MVFMISYAQILEFVEENRIRERGLNYLHSGHVKSFTVEDGFIRSAMKSSMKEKLNHVEVSKDLEHLDLYAPMNNFTFQFPDRNSRWVRH